MKKWQMILAAVCVTMLLSGCVAEVKTVPFDVEEPAAARNIDVVQAYDIRSVFTVENGLMREQFGFDGEDMLLGTSRESKTNLEKLYAVDPGTGVSHQLMQTRFGKVEHVETLQGGSAIVYLIRGEKNGKFTGYRLFLWKESDGKVVKLDEWNATNVTEVFLAEKISCRGSEISYIWHKNGDYWLTCVNTETMEKRFYFLGEILPEVFEEQVQIKAFYQIDNLSVGGSIQLSEKEYYWQAELPAAKRSVEDGWQSSTEMGVHAGKIISGEWVIENVRVMELPSSRAMQIGKHVYYLTAEGELYQMNSKSEEAKRIAKDVDRFCISGDEKTVVYAAEKNGAVMLYADRIGEYYPALINVSSEVESFSINEDGSKVALSYYPQRDRRENFNTAIFDIVYGNGQS